MYRNAMAMIIMQP